MISGDFCQNDQYVINFTFDGIILKFEAFTKNKLDTLYLTEIMITEWIEIIYECWDEGDTP